ncbi:MAG: lipopolysaccharide heptosyltransferase II [Candidatus Omnitrophota bacterium]|jgi:lipopolysaccharide heptosyltransferase II
MSNRILIVNVNWLGDVLFSTPFIRAVREAHPDSHITCLVHPRCAEILQDNPRINEIIIYDEEGVHKSLLGKLKLIFLLRNKKFDTAFLLHRSFTKALIVKLTGVRELIGYPTKNRSMLLTGVVEEPDEPIHKVEYFLNVARHVGIKPVSASYEFFITNQDRNYAKELMRMNNVQEKDLTVVLCPGGNWDPKRWPKESFAALADLLIERLGAKIVISGGRKEYSLAEGIGKLMKHESVNICSRTTLKQLAAIFETASLVIANDTGTMHLAVAMKARVIALFGPTSSAITGPYGEGRYSVISSDVPCDIPCYDITCTDNKCMRSIKVEDVFLAAERMLKGDEDR